MARACAVLIVLCGCTPRPSERWTYRGQFHRCIATADRIVVRDGGYDCCEPVDGQKVLFEVTDRAEITEVAARIEFPREQGMGFCMCCGYPGIDWYRGGRRLALTSVQHGRGLRWKGFPGDAGLTEASADWLVEWLAKHGVTQPKEEIAEGKRLAAIAAEAREAMEPFVPEGFREAIENAEADNAGNRAKNPGLDLSEFEDAIRDLYIRRAFEGRRDAMYPSLLRLLGCLPMTWDSFYFPEQREAQDFLVRAPRDELDAALRLSAQSDDARIRRGAARLVYSQHYMTNHEKTERDIVPWMELLADAAYADPFAENRRLVLSRLGKHPGAGAMAVLRPAVEDPDPTVRRKAIAALAARGSEEAWALLRRVAGGATRPRQAAPAPKNYGEGGARFVTPGMDAKACPGTDREAARKALEAREP
jgi:hypothetical protein